MFEITRSECEIHPAWYLSWEHGAIDICPLNEPYEFALDVAMMFMDRWEAGDFPRDPSFEDEPNSPWHRNPFALMRECCEQAQQEAAYGT